MSGGTDRKKRKPSTYGYAVLGVVFVFVFINWAVSWLHKPDTSALPPLSAAGKPYAAALQERLQDEGPIWVGKTGLSASEARCVASPWTMLVDPDELSRLGLDPDEFAAHPDAAFRKVGLEWDDATRLRAAYERCGMTSLDLAQRGVAAAQTDLPEADADALRTCVNDQLSSEFTDHVFNTSITTGELSANDRDVTMQVKQVVTSCNEGGS